MWPYLLISAGTTLAAAWINRKKSAPAEAKPAKPKPTSPPAPKFSGLWLWPVPTLGDRRSVISDGWGSPRKNADGTTRTHRGADIMFKRRTGSDLLSVYPAGTSNGTAGYFMPDGVPAIAAADGKIKEAKRTSRGFSVVIAHADGWATYYTHLDQLAVSAGQAITAGQPIGLISYDPTDSRKLKHLHLELWRGGSSKGAVDPGKYLGAWQRVAIASWSPPAPRNGNLAYRPVGGRGEPYPDWLRRLKGESGVYIIRRDGEVLYIGQSSAGRLYETLTRHFQAWRRWKGFWKGQYAEGHDPGLTYDREKVEVAVRVTSADDALDEEARLIERLRPRDNLLGQPDADDVPF
jgi:hypothetical protein